MASPAGEHTGNTSIDVDVLAAQGITDLSGYGLTEDIGYDIFVDPPVRS